MRQLTPDERRRRKTAIEDLLRQGYAPPGVASDLGSALYRYRTLHGFHLGKWLEREIEARDGGLDSYVPDWSQFNPGSQGSSLAGVSAVPVQPQPDNDNAAPEAADEVAAQDTPETRREAHDAAFWKRRAGDQSKEIASLELLVEELGGIRSLHTTPPPWLRQAPITRPGDRSVVSMLFTDLHMGEVVDPDELLGLNAYNPDIAGARVRRYFQAACEIGPRWSSDTRCQGALLQLGGDLISGDIHEELRITNGLTAHEQVRETVALIRAGIHELLKVYPRVHVASVPGNHARTTHKPTAKLYSRLSYDTLIANMVADAFVGIERVTFQIGAAPDALIPVLGHSLLLTHGDKIGSGGGQGFAGPLLPIIRGGKKVEAQQARAGRRPDLICHGHFHTSGNPGNILANGSFVGMSEYGHGLRAALEPPQQWLFLLHETWGLRERAEIKLETPGVPSYPAAPTMPAAMSLLQEAA